jgi:site-specific recombinase XerD
MPNFGGYTPRMAQGVKIPGMPQSLPASTPATLHPVDLAEMLPSWQRALKAERKAAGTRTLYTGGVRVFLAWCENTGTPAVLDKAIVQEWINDVLDGGAEAATAQARLKALRRFSAWLTEERILATDPLLGIRPPKQDRKVVQALDEDQLKALLKACSGTRLADRRDEAIVRLMIDTGARASEVVGLATDDVDLDGERVTIQRGKGGKGRVVPIGPQTVMALDRYLRMRRQHSMASSGALWLGAQENKTFGYPGLNRALKARARAAGIEGFHCHLMRHTFATRWKAKVGTDDGLMAVAGWSSRAMIDRYAGAAAAARAADEARRLGLGDL